MSNYNYHDQYIKYKNEYLQLKTSMDGGGKASNFIDCHKLAKEHLTDTERKAKKKEVYDYLLKNVFKTPNFNKLTPKDIRDTFRILDKVYFNKKIEKYIIDEDLHLDFKTSAKLTKSAGICKYKDKDRKCKYQIGVSSVILESLFKKGEKSFKIGGLQCNNILECYINIFEHELTHLIIFMFCPKLGLEMGGHTETFKDITKNLYGHTKYKHMLLEGDYETMKKKKKELKTNIEIGDYVISKPFNGKTFEGVVKKISGKSVTLLLDNGQMVRIYYQMIDRIEGNKKEILKKIDDNIEEIKKTLKAGNEIKVKLRGKIQTGTVVSVNPKKVRVKLEDGKDWMIPYELILV